MTLIELRQDTAKPIYQQLEQQLIRLIEDGTIAPGTTLPAERRLAEDLGLSRATVQRCYNMLRDRKILSAHGRLGSIVQGMGLRVHTGMDRLKGFTEEMRELGREPSSAVVEQKITSDRSIASIFGLPSPYRFLKLVRVRKGDGIPLSREVAWYDLSSVPKLAESELTGSVYGRLAEIGNPLVYCDQSIEATSPSDEECRIFGFPEPVPCLLIKRRSYDVNRRMIEYVEGLFRGDTYSYQVKLKA
ncbi:GntR family transcriptional regulator [soil metagenome]